MGAHGDQELRRKRKISVAVIIGKTLGWKLQQAQDARQQPSRHGGPVRTARRRREPARSTLLRVVQRRREEAHTWRSPPARDHHTQGERNLSVMRNGSVDW